jgi:hypothetical protein
MTNKLKFIKIKDELPGYGEPVLLFTGGVIQHITYFRDGEGDYQWFEPHYFDHDDDFKIDIQNVDSWIYVDDISLAKE